LLFCVVVWNATYIYVAILGEDVYNKLAFGAVNASLYAFMSLLIRYFAIEIILSQGKNYALVDKFIIIVFFTYCSVLFIP